jgi:hypothetical protein
MHDVVYDWQYELLCEARFPIHLARFIEGIKA